jgi:hypothetical protein
VPDAIADLLENIERYGGVLLLGADGTTVSHNIGTCVDELTYHPPVIPPKNRNDVMGWLARADESSVSRYEYARAAAIIRAYEVGDSGTLVLIDYANVGDDEAGDANIVAHVRPELLRGVLDVFKEAVKSCDAATRRWCELAGVAYISPQEPHAKSPAPVYAEKV